MKDWAQREAEKLGTTPAEVLRKLFADACNKYEVAEAMAGTPRQNLFKLLKKHGVEKQHCRAFEWDGVTASFSVHCNRLGLNKNNLQAWRARNKKTLRQAVEHYALGRQRCRAWKNEG